MKITVTGVKGQLGYDVMKVLHQRGDDAVGVDIDDFDITDSSAVLSFLESGRPDAVIHCSAYTAVDRAEENEKLCRAVNVDGTCNIAAACKKIGAKMVFLSTDYVFEGTGTQAHEVDDKKAPPNVYGRSKLEGEDAVRKILARHFIVRTSWVFGKNGNNFVKTMLRLGKQGGEINVVNDQVGSPTYTADLAPLLRDMIDTEKFGTYHATNQGYCSWADFAMEIFRQAGYPTKVNFVPSSLYPTKAKRPLNSRLSKKSIEKAGFHLLPAWQNALARYLKEIKELP
ncbi:dTDP-4-dehydrorhamnose reductase [Caproiciproducens sp. NJN-50]|uniref:dTDP-4-dehydrorhamnose reductase n=1 Tax=Acutalibacteraceae TaxID=3082771 RepID=UPI000FFE3363|nr:MULTISPECIES: dTDP-4-dehydrorhamnose reductase [Acutalibacteraceae]QAT50104.1 dTDP-4-dehydrorhamnose reductase [Caproiciproducens sp. NJN-50]